MKKFLQVTICMAFAMTLCIGLIAQNERGAPEGKIQQHFFTNDDSAGSFLALDGGPTSETIFTVKNSPFPAYKGTVANPFGSQIGTTGGAVQCLEYIDGKIYGVRWAGGNQFGTLDPSTGAFTVIKASFHTQGTDGASIAYNPVDGKTYVFPWTGEAPEATRYGTVDLETGDFTTIATFGTTGPTYYAAIDEDGTCYAVQNLTNKFGTINLATGSFTEKATLAGITSINYIQDLSFDRETGELYWLGKADQGAKDSYWKIDKATGALTNLGSNSFDAQGFTTLTWFGNPPPDCDPAKDLEIAYTDDCEAELTWKAPGTASYNYNIYRDGELIKTVVTESYKDDDDFDVFAGHTWEVKVVCTDNLSTPISKELPACKEEIKYDPVTSLNGNCIDGTVTLTWNAPESDVKQYDVYEGENNLGKTEELTYTISDVSDGEHNYCVVAVYEGGASEKVCIKVECEVGVKDIKTTFSIVPNPATNNIIIKAKSDFNKVEILSFLGQIVVSESNNGKELSLDISNLTNGVYFVRIISENGTSVKKFVKQ
jgi:hypothetical protein